MIIKDLPFFHRLLPRYPLYPALMRSDIEVCMDPAGMVRQRTTPAIVNALQRIYANERSNLDARATDADNTEYYMDFWSFMQAMWLPRLRAPANALDVGCGDGFLVGWLKEWGATNKDDSRAAGIHFEPLPPGRPFDLIVHHHVLEHVLDPLAFLALQRVMMHHEGLLCFAVPDCTVSIATGDVSMFLHQHISYFTQENLVYLLGVVGFEVVGFSKNGGSLYVAAIPRAHPLRLHQVGLADWARASAFEEKMAAALDKFARAYVEAPAGEIGVYCPLRALPYLAAGCVLDTPRLFDDTMAGHYIDGMKQRIESFEDLLADPPAVVFVMSLTHGDAIADKLEIHLMAAGKPCRVITLADILA